MNQTINKADALAIAKKIVELDLLRDQIFEKLIDLSGSEAYDLLRKVQNGLVK